MYSRFHLVMIASILLLTVFIVVAFFTLQRETGFREQGLSVGRATLSAAANQVTSVVANLQDRVHIFVEEQQRQIRHLATNGQDDAAIEEVQRLLKRRFPHYFAFTITDVQGHPLLEDVESLVGDLCRQDLQHYSQRVVSLGTAYRNPTWLHPLPGNYHFDVMAHWQGAIGALNRGGVFFVSFRPDLLVRVLKRHALPGYQLLLVKDDDRSLIEMSAAGSRDELEREIHLTAAEQQRIEMSRAIDGTAWRLMLLPDADLQGNFQRRIWLQAAAVMGLALVLTLLLLGWSAWHHRKGNFEL